MSMAMPIIPWIGGKRRLADVLIRRFPPYTCYVEVFAGAAALFFMRPPTEVEVLNYVNDDHVLLELMLRPQAQARGKRMLPHEAVQRFR
jgi:site-specific DNA-adenine methylase